MSYKFENDKYRVMLESDCECNPRTDMDNLGKMVCSHGRYDVPNEINFEFNDYNSWGDAKKALAKDYCVILPVYMYDHSGQTVSTKPFGCPWDSGQLGFIVASKKDIRETYCIKNVTKKILERVEKELIEEVKMYDQYLTGDIYLAVITNLETNEQLDCCGGYYGTDWKENGVYDLLLENFDETLCDEIVENIDIA